MKIRLFLAIAIILFSITSGVEIFGMNEKEEKEENIDDERINNINNEKNGTNIREENIFQKINNDLLNSRSNIYNTNINLDDNDDIEKNLDINECIEENNNRFSGNFYESLNKEDSFFINKPFKENKGKNELFLRLYNMVGKIYYGSLWFTFFEFYTSFGISILNNIFGFEKMVKNKFYANMLLLKFGFKLAIPFLSFIIVDFNICVYNWLSGCMKYVMIYYHKTPLDEIGIKWKANCIENKLKFIYLLNIFNIDIKLNLFGLSLCFPLTKILEALLIYKGMQEIRFDRNIKQKLVTWDNIESGGVYNDIYNKVENNYEDTNNTIDRFKEKYKNIMNCVEEISNAAKEIFMHNNNINNNNNGNNENNNNDGNNENNNDNNENNIDINNINITGNINNNNNNIKNEEEKLDADVEQ